MLSWVPSFYLLHLLDLVVLFLKILFLIFKCGLHRMRYHGPLGFSSCNITSKMLLGTRGQNSLSSFPLFSDHLLHLKNVCSASSSTPFSVNFPCPALVTHLHTVLIQSRLAIFHSLSDRVLISQKLFLVSVFAMIH